MIQSLTVDVAALQRLEETEPLGPSLVEGGLCGTSCLLASFCLLASCALVGTGTGQGSPPEE
ncbi:MAG: hypothetical protein ACRDTT_07630 [Pseudonocardiaceae bacterium]